VDFGAGRVSTGGGRRSEPRLVPDADVRTYYDRPVLKAPVWKARYIPTYFFAGGLVSRIVDSLLFSGGAQPSNQEIHRHEYEGNQQLGTLDD
jgi:hypothetical protein